MNVIIPIGLFFVLLCFFFRNNKGNGEYITFTMAMFIIAAVLSVRYNYGTDYLTYSNIYDNVHGVNDLSNWKDGKIEFLYIQLLSLFPSFEIYIALQTFLWFGVIWWFYTKYTERTFLWFVLFFVFFNVAGISTNITALRTNIVSILFVPAFIFLMNNKKRDKLYFVGIVILSSLFHRSAIILLPLVLLNTKSRWVLKNQGSLWIMLLVIGGISFLFKNSLTIYFSNTIIESMPDYFESYSDYLEDYANMKLSGLSTLVYLAQLFVFFNGLRVEKDEKYIVLMKIGAIFVIAELFVAEYLLSRYVAILYPAYIVAFIRSLKYLRKDFSVAVMVVVMLLSSWNFYQTRTSRSSDSTTIYQSILDK